MRMTRRDFLVIASACVLGILNLEKVFPSSLEQKIVLNLPSYDLNLITSDNQIYSFPVGIGRGYAGRRETPIGEGFVYEKRERVLFRYGENHPKYKKKKGDIIKWTNTFNENGIPTEYAMPYSKMRGIGLKIKEHSSDLYSNRFVIHSTTDEFTLTIPSSSGCIRLGMNDMLKLYDLIERENKSGLLKKPIPIKTTYNLVEIKDKELVIHANVYNKKINYLDEFKKIEFNLGCNNGLFNYSKIEEEFRYAEKSFRETHRQIQKKLIKPFPDNFVSNQLKEKLHKKYPIFEFRKVFCF